MRIALAVAWVFLVSIVLLACRSHHDPLVEVIHAAQRGEVACLRNGVVQRGPANCR